MTEIPNYLKDIVLDGVLPPDLSGLSWNFMRYLREEALERFLQQGLPTQKEEDWHYTSLSGVEKQHWQRILSTTDIQDTIPSLVPDSIGRLLFVDGYHSDAHARMKRIPPGLHITSLQEALQERNEKVHAFLQDAPSESWHDLNMALFDDGILIEVEPGVKITQPLELVFLATECAAPATYHARIMIDMGEGSSLDVVEMRGGRGIGHSHHFGSTIATHHLAAGAQLRKTCAIASSPHAIRLMHEKTLLAERANFELNLMHLGGGLVRQSVETHHAGENARSSLRALNYADGRHIDLLTNMRHEAPHTQSRQEIRALARNKGHTVFQGKVLVEKNAQKTDAHQMHRAMLLS
ncbi:MAG: SufD family Fe-S cluster assembly protein, partial [Proteobacteria bacterium]|nr:SufD family Fe-S cluster assembly protein [Pseudomonadota bacterium]